MYCYKEGHVIPWIRHCIQLTTCHPVNIHTMEHVPVADVCLMGQYCQLACADILAISLYSITQRQSRLTLHRKHIHFNASSKTAIVGHLDYLDFDHSIIIDLSPIVTA